MEMSQVAPELRRPMHRVTRLPIPADRAWGRRVTRMLLALLPTSKLEGVTIETPKVTDSSVRVYRPTVRRSPAACSGFTGADWSSVARFWTIACAL